jgi:hypothetical protein
MLKAKKIRGPKPAANDVGVPEGEMLLAQMVKRAKARGVRPVHGPKYAAADGSYVSTWEREEKACYACAIGALEFDAATRSPIDLISGHERPDDAGDPETEAYQAGAAYVDAMGGRALDRR